MGRRSLPGSHRGFRSGRLGGSPDGRVRLPRSPAESMNVRRGDVVLVDFPYPGGTGSKVRPAVVIQNDRDNGRLLNTIVAQVTGTTHRTQEATQVLIDTKTPEGKQAGLSFDSVVNCVNIVTLDKS